MPVDDRRYPKLVTRVAVGAGLEPSHVVESQVCDQSPGGLRLKVPTRIGAAHRAWTPIHVPRD